MKHRKVPKFVEELSLSIRKAEGQNLIRSALKEVQKQNHERVVKTVSILLERVRLMERLERQTNLRLLLTRNQLKAINDGKITILPDVAAPDNIVYTDEELNIPWDATAKW